MPHVIRSGAEAVEVARKLAAAVAGQAGERDRDRRAPTAELAELSASGLLGVTVPARHGGAEVGVTALAEVFRTLAAADASLTQIPQSHFVFLDALRRQGTAEQQSRFFARALDGARFANAQTERGGRASTLRGDDSPHPPERPITDDTTSLRRTTPGRYVLDGVKYYSTGALFADVLVVRAVLADEPPLPDGSAPKALAYVDRDAPGVVVEDDWDGMGQRTTASGTVRLEGVPVAADDLVPYNAIFAGPTTYGARAQILHAALDAGIARGAVAAAVTAAGRARPWFESGAATAAGDPLLVQRAGELEITVRGAEALLREAAEAIDAAERAPSDDAAARASIATATAKVATGRAALEASSALFELGGTRSAAGGLNLSRHWRDARTHTLHDPERWKVQHIGRWLLAGTPPPRHGQL